MPECYQTPIPSLSCGPAVLRIVRGVHEDVVLRTEAHDVVESWLRDLMHLAKDLLESGGRGASAPAKALTPLPNGIRQSAAWHKPPTATEAPGIGARRLPTSIGTRCATADAALCLGGIRAICAAGLRASLRLRSRHDVGRRVELDRSLGSYVVAQGAISFLEDVLDLLLGEDDSHHREPTSEICLHHRPNARKSRRSAMRCGVHGAHASALEQIDQLRGITEQKRCPEGVGRLRACDLLEQHNFNRIGLRSLEGLPNGDRDPTTRHEYAKHLAKRCTSVREEHQTKLTDYRVERVGLVGQGFRSTLSPFDSRRLMGKAILAWIWATRCPVCQRMAPSIVDLERKFRGEQLEVVGFNVDQALGLSPSDQDRLDYARQKGMQFTNLLLDEESWRALGRINIVPCVFLVDSQGKVQRFFINIQEPQTLEEAVRQVLGRRNQESGVRKKEKGRVRSPRFAVRSETGSCRQLKTIPLPSS